MNTAMLEHPRPLRTCARSKRARNDRRAGERFSGRTRDRAGRLAGEDAIVAAIEAVLSRTRDLMGERVLITAARRASPSTRCAFFPTRRPERWGSNWRAKRSRAGASVDLVLGPTSLTPPSGANVERVTTALEMERAALAHAAGATIAIATAAVADWRPAETHASKVKKTDDAQALRLERNPDILAALGARKNGRFWSALRPRPTRTKRTRAKNSCASISMHCRQRCVGERGFGAGDSALTVLWGTDGRRALPTSSKRVLAGGLWDTIVAIRRETRG